MPDLVELMEQCQRDTQEVLGNGRAGRLAYWLDYRNDRGRLVKFIQDRYMVILGKTGRVYTNVER